MSVVGVDACKRGWIAIEVRADQHARGHFIDKLDNLLGHVPDVQTVAVDIPIGLPSRDRRQADVAAREFLGPRRSSVFFTPVREAFTAPTHAEASAISKDRTGHGISQQAYALGPKILEAEPWTASAPVPVWEVHPEVSFAVMMSQPAAWPKSTWLGMRERLDALDRQGITLDGVGAAGGMAGMDDVLDAAAAAWSALRIGRGDGLCLPDPPETVPGTGRGMAIWA